MNFSINKDVLLTNLLIVSKALASKTVNQLLQSIKLDINEDTITLTASNGEISIKNSFKDKSLKVIEGGSVLIPGKYFLESVRMISSYTVEFNLIDENIISIKSGTLEYKLNLWNVEDYPNVDFLDLLDSLKIGSSTLRTIIREVAFNAAINDKKPILTGINFKYSNHLLTVVATDSFRLARKELALELNYKDFEITIPNKSLDELLKILESYEEDVNIYITSNKVLFKINDLYFQTRLLDGQYPETSRIIPSSFDCILCFNKVDLLTSVESVALLATRESGTNLGFINFSLRSDKVLEIRANNSEVGNAVRELIPSNDVIGNNLKISFSSKYLVDVLRSLQTNEIVMSFVGSFKPIVIRELNNNELTHLIIPVRVD
ncbi:MAG: DNA polymerase III subunit beta [Acholeplasmatales bacterium]|jgi:DNA polymerase-3 subunit beta|nr:DNA polymerase III subunit beta [Acholeplasmatales bacterium]